MSQPTTSSTAAASPNVTGPVLAGWRVGWVGTGLMGLPMAGHVQAAGGELHVCTRTPARAADLIARGATLATTPAELATCVDVLCMCVPDTPDVEQVVGGGSGIIAGLAKRSCTQPLVVLDHSTICPRATIALSRQLADAGATLIDAPVSGGQVGAQKATLSIMLGGPADMIERVMPLLRCMGKSIVHAGPSGFGQFTKLANQIAGAVHLLAMAETLTFASAAGLDLTKVIDAVGSGAAASWMLSNLGPRAARGDFAPGFMIDLQQKDLRLVQQAAATLGTALPATAIVQQLFLGNQACGEGREGTQAIVKSLLRLAGKSSL